jgi:hypothetical protein
MRIAASDSKQDLGQGDILLFFIFSQLQTLGLHWRSQVFPNHMTEKNEKPEIRGGHV